jgi:hypothetical protein
VAARIVRFDHVSARAIWALLLVLGRELRASCRPTTSRALWMESNGRAHLLTAHEATGKPARECYPLADVVSGVRETVQALRSGDYEVWNGAKAVPVRELAAV